LNDTPLTACIKAAYIRS